MRSKVPPSDSGHHLLDPEEADAVHRRFLPQPQANLRPAVKMSNKNGNYSGGGDLLQGIVNGHPNDMDDDTKNNLIGSSGGSSAAGEGELLGDKENNIIPLKSESPDYGATGEIGFLNNGSRKGSGGGSNEEESHFGFVGGTAELDSPNVRVERCGGGGGKELGSPKEKFGFDWMFLKRFWKMQGLLFLSLCSASTALFFFLLCFVLLKELVGYQVGLIASGFYKALGERDLDAFWRQTFMSVGLILGIAFIKCSTSYTQKVLTVTFRRMLCEACHRLYFADIRFYQLNILDKSVDNPDQRMTQDIERFCTTYCEVLPKLLVSPFTIVYYCYQGYLRSGYEGPLGCFGFFLLATALNKIVMGTIVYYVAKQEKCEGDFRFLHTLVRVNSESIAFHKAAMMENDKVDVALDKLIDTQKMLYWRQYLLSFLIDFFDYIGSIVSYLMLAIPIFNGKYDHLTPAELSFLISQNAFILIYLISTFTSLVDQSGKFADIAGYTHRIAQLLERLNALEEFWSDVAPDEMGRNRSDCALFDDWLKKRKQIRENMNRHQNHYNNTRDGADNPLISNDTNDGDYPEKGRRKLPIWTLENLTFSTPTKEEPLVANLSMEFVVGESVIITGPSSAGKSSLLRVLRGLWPFSEGSLRRHYPPGAHGVYFCPQNPYLTWGTLREQITFPLRPDSNHLDNKLILYYIERLRLMPVVERVGGLDCACSWSLYDSLSPGEKQRLCLLRVFYHQPVVAVLDEVTSSLSLDMQEFVHSEMKRLGITMISVGHQESIRKYHDKQLIISPKKGAAVYPIAHDDD